MNFKSIKIGEQIWTVENIAVAIAGSLCYENDPGNGEIFGRLYTFQQALDVEKLFPGWRLPTKEDVEQLIFWLGGKLIAGSKMKVGGTSGFNAWMAGYHEPGDQKFYRINEQTGFWTSTSDSETTAWKFYLMVENGKLHFHPVDKMYGDSIRLIKI